MPAQPSRQLTPHWKWDFVTSMRNATVMKMRSVMRCGKHSRRGRISGRTSCYHEAINNNHRPERVKPAFEASHRRLQLDYVDCYLIHTPFAFQSGDEQDPKDARGQVIYDSGATLVETWRGWSASSTTASASRSADISLEKLQQIIAAARIKPAVVEVESRPYHPQSELFGFCRQHGIVLLAFAALGSSIM
jgi:diketogulonate reductase-like aldo/keto reductase